MKLILLGAPGAGKGTQAQLLTEKLGIPSISTGNMLRDAMANDTPLGRKVRPFMESGALVSDDLIMGLIAERTAQPDCKNGFILDGVPRTLAQAEAMEAAGLDVDYVVSIEVDDAVIAARMTGRRACPKCGATYHIENNPPKVQGICDLCGEGLTIRKDDTPETVLHRLEVYHAQTEVLKTFYQQRGKLVLIEGNRPIEDANRDILEAIGAKV